MTNDTLQRFADGKARGFSFWFHPFIPAVRAQVKILDDHGSVVEHLPFSVTSDAGPQGDGLVRVQFDRPLPLGWVVTCGRASAPTDIKDSKGKSK